MTQEVGLTPHEASRPDVDRGREREKGIKYMRSPGDARVREGDRARVRARVGGKRARDEDATDETGRRMRRQSRDVVDARCGRLGCERDAGRHGHE